jgi:hydroxyquinol 1,2-dioxygenase
MDFTEETATGAVVASFEGTPDPRLRAVLASLVRHLHGFVRAVAFLTATGRRCDDQRQEFILLSDVLGVTMLVDAINHRKASAATESTVLGPFHVVASPRRELGDSIDLVGTGQPCVVSGRVASLDGGPLPGALVDVWQADDHGFYDVQRPDAQPEGNGRGLFACDGDGRFWFRTVTPSAYPIPTDGPVGDLLTASGRHPYRPAHIHLIVAADGHLPVTTHIFVAGSPYLDSDAVFAVKQSLVRDFAEVDDPDQAAAYGVEPPFRHARFDVVLQPAG